MSVDAAVEPGPWFAVVDAGSGELVSLGTVVADPLPDGLEATEVAYPDLGQVWDADTREWVTPEAPPAPPNPAAVLVELSVVAGDPSLSTEQKLTQVFAILAAAT